MAQKTDLMDIEKLVDELMKEQPNDALVQQMMVKLKIPYSHDPIQRMNNVLIAMHPPIDAEPKLQ